VSDIQDGLNQEIIDRTDGDANLQSQIDNISGGGPPYDDTGIKADLAQEVADREAGDAALDAKITKEVSDRAAGDTALDAKINKEVTDRTDADAVLDGKITKEINDRKDGDAALDAKITKEIGDRTTADKALDDKKLNKAGDDLTGDITLKPTPAKRWIGLKNFPPKNPDGSNDTSESFGTRIDIDTLNTWRSRFKVTSRYGDIFMISGGGGPALHVGPVNTMSDPDDPANEKKRVPLFLSPGEPENDDEAASKQYVDELGERLTADADLDWWGYGDYTFKRASDSAGVGFLQCKAPGGAPKAKDITQVWIHKTNRDGDTLDMSAAFHAGNVLKLVKNSNAAYYRILDERDGNTNNIELDLQWFRGMDTTTFYVNDIIRVEEGTSRLSDYAHLNSANQFQASNHFNAATYFERSSSGSGYSDWKVKGHQGDLDQNKDLLSVYRNPVVADEQDAVNYYGKTDGDNNIVTRSAIREAIADSISNLDVQLPKFHFFRSALDITCIADPGRMPLLPPQNFFIPKSTESSNTWNTWPGNVSWLDLHLGDLIDEGLATGMGNFIIKTVGGDIKLAGMIMGYAGRVSIQGKSFERLRVGKWTAAGNQWLDHEVYRIELSGTHWEKK